MENLQEENKQYQQLGQEIKEALKSNDSELKKINIDELARPIEEKDKKEEGFKSETEGYLPTQESLHHIFHERETLQSELDSQKAKERVLYSEVLELEKQNQERLQELREVQRERDGLLAEKRKMERRLDIMMDESASIVSSLIVVQTDMEERMERKERYARMFSERALAMLNNTGRMMGLLLGDGKEEIVECEVSGNDGKEIGEEMSRKFAMGFEAIERDFKSRVEKMEEMKRKVELLEGCVEEEMKRKVELLEGCVEEEMKKKRCL